MSGDLRPVAGLDVEAERHVLKLWRIVRIDSEGEYPSVPILIDRFGLPHDPGLALGRDS
jgi:hypothetical protein